MPNLPLLTPDYLASPTMFGAVSPLTASIMSKAGADLSKTIEENAQKFEAQQKAPQIANMMGNGLSLLSRGDSSGFSMLAQAHAMGSTNPFLAKLTEDGVRQGATVYNSHITEANSQNRFNQTLTLAEIQDNRSRVRQAHTDERVDEKRVEIAHDEWVKDEAARKKQAEMNGETFVGNPEPIRPKRLGGPGAPSIPVEANAVTTGSNPLFGADTGLPAPPMDNFTPGVGATTPPKATATPMTRAQIQGQTVLPSNAPAPAVAATPAVAAGANNATPINMPSDREQIMKIALKNNNNPTIVNGVLKEAGEDPLTPQESKTLLDKFHVVPFGTMQFDVLKQKEDSGTTRKSVTSSEGTVTKTTGDNKKDSTAALTKEFIELAGSAGNMDVDFAMWASKQISEGKKVHVGPNPNDPKAPWIAKNSDGVPMSDLNPLFGKEGQDKTKLHPIPKEVGKAWDRAQQIIPLIKDNIQIEFTGSPEERAKLSPEDTKKWQDTAIEGLATHKDPKSVMELVNAKLAEKGVPAVSWEDVEKFKESKLDPQLLKSKNELNRLGVKIPDSEYMTFGQRVQKTFNKATTALVGLLDKYSEDPQKRIDVIEDAISKHRDRLTNRELIRYGEIIADAKEELANRQKRKEEQ